MKCILILLLTTTIALAINLPTNSVVKIFSSVSFFNYKYPWQTAKVSKYIGSGAIIKDNQILTSAHVVSNARFIEIKRENDPKKYLAKIKYISHQADLALLEVKDKNFFNHTKPLLVNEKIKHRDAVTVF